MREGARPVVVVGAPEHPRSAALAAALGAAGRPPARFIGYDAVLRDPDILAAALGPGDLLRFDSPGDGRGNLRALLAAGAADCAAAAGYAALAGADLEAALAEPARIIGPAQLWFGLCEAWRRAEAVATQAGAAMLSRPREMALAFDKTATCVHLAALGLPVPGYLGAPAGFDALEAAMADHAVDRVFLKLRFGSGAAGALALARNRRGGMIGHTTAALRDGRLLSLSRPVRLDDRRTIAALVDALGRLGSHLECWVPKASAPAGGACDLRVLLVGGDVAHVVLRSSTTPITNLHLGAARADAAALRARLAPGAWDAAIETCRAVGRAFPGSFMLGLDLAFLAGLRRHVVLEVNAFGDHLKDVLHEGRDTYGWQVERWDAWAAAA